MKYINLYNTIDWVSVKLMGISVVTCTITGTLIATTLGIIAAASTIIYNVIRIYKELKKNKRHD